MSRAVDLLARNVSRGMTVTEAAKYLRIGPDRLRAMIRRGEVGAIETGTRRRPRLVILPHHITDYERRHQAAQPQPVPRRRRQAGIIDYYPDTPGEVGR